MSGTVGLDDPTVFNRTAVYKLRTFPDALGVTGNAYGGVHAPDVVGNIRVNAILPGLVAGDRQRRVLEAKAQQRGISYAEMERTAFSYTSIKDYVTPEQIADQIIFMCSPRGRTISGQAISICGDTQMLG